MNNTKVAIVWTDKRNPEYYLTSNWATKLPKYFKKNFEFSFFALSTINSAIFTDKDDFTIWLKPDTKTLCYSVTRFCEPDILIVIGSSNYNFENLFTDSQKKRILIHKGKEHKEGDFNLFNLTIVEILSDKINYKNAVVQPVVDIENYMFQKLDKFYSVCYPQEVSDEKYSFFNKVRFYGSISNNLSTTVKLPLYRHDTLNVIFNQSKAVSIIEDFDSFELAMSSLSCNTPVVALQGTKASLIEGVKVASMNDREYIKETISAIKSKIKTREEYIVPNFTVEKLSTIIKEIL